MNERERSVTVAEMYGKSEAPANERGRSAMMAEVYGRSEAPMNERKVEVKKTSRRSRRKIEIEQFNNEKSKKDGWMNGVLGHFYALSRLNWAGDNLG